MTRTPPRRSAAAAAAAAAAIARASGAVPTSASPPRALPVPPIVVARATGPTQSNATTMTHSSPLASPMPRRRDHVVRLLTFNLWFEPLAMATRMRAIGRFVERLRPAVIGFQEVTRESLAMLKQQRWASYYDCSADTVPPFSEAYFVVLFSALPVRSLETLPFANTGMGRELLAARVELTPGLELLVATSHLESLPPFARTRVSQLQQSFAFLSERVTTDTRDGVSCVGAVFMGDTNLLRGDMALLDPQCAAAEALTVEDATSGRATCRICSERIEKASRRVGKRVTDRLPQSGKAVETTHWFHHACFLGDKAATKDEKCVVQQHVHGAQDDHAAAAAATRGLPPHWRDLWLSVAGHSEANGATYDGKRNTMIKNKNYQSRLDRVYLYTPTPTAQQALQSIEMVGTEPIADGLWASDHFGLLTTLCFDDVATESRDHADAKRKRDEDTTTAGIEPPKRRENNADGPSQRSSGSKHAPIELE